VEYHTLQAGSFESLIFNAAGSGFIVIPKEYSTVELYDLSGKKVWSEKAATAKGVQIPSGIAAGVLRARFIQ